MHWRWRALGAALLVAALLLAERADGAPKRRRPQKIGRSGEGDEAAVDSNAIDGGGSGRGLSESESRLCTGACETKFCKCGLSHAVAL